MTGITTLLFQSYMDKIYKLLDPITLEPRYIGYTLQPLNERLKKHLRDSLLHKNTNKQKWIRSLMVEGLKPIIKIIKYLPKHTPEPWQYWETHYIKLYRELGYNLTNGTDGGEGCSKVMTQATKDKISRAKIGKVGKLCPNSNFIIAYREGEELSFHGAREAERYLRGLGIKVSSQNIGKCLLGIRNTAAGYKFKYR